MEDIIGAAILERRLLQIQYGGGTRLVEPYCFGVSTKNNPVLSAYQLEGHSNSRALPGWRRFIVNEIENIALQDERFLQIRAGYNPTDSQMTRVFCCVEP